MIIAIEQLQFSELIAFLRVQSDDAFPDLKDEERLNMLAEKWYKDAEFCTCRNDDDILIGMIAFYANQAESGFAYIPHVYVSETYRGKRVFSSLLLMVKDYVKSKGFHFIRLEVQNENIRALKAYQKNGFTEMGRSDSSIYMENELL